MKTEPTAPQYEVGPTFVALWSGWCPTCRTPIDTGDTCRNVNGYAWCRPCADVAAAQARP